MGEEIQKCPKCGSQVRASIPDVGIQFECATIVYGDGHVAEALPCVMRQRDQLAERVKVVEIERDELKVKSSFDELALQKMEERVKRLEAVGDKMAELLDCYAGFNETEEWACSTRSQHIGETRRATEAWVKAKGQP